MPWARASHLIPVVRGQGVGADKTAAWIGHVIGELLRKDERYDVVDLEQALGNAERERALRAFQVAEEKVQKGRQAYEALELDKAVEQLNTTLTRYEHQAAYVADFKKVAEALMLLGAIHVLRGEEKQGGLCLEQAIGVYPKVEPDPRIFNPAMRRLFQATLKRVQGKPFLSLSVTSYPSYAEVYVDGHFMGITPASVGHIPEGRHFVRVEKQGYRPWGRLIEVSVRQEATVDATLKPTQQLDAFEHAVQAAMKHVVKPPGHPKIHVPASVARVGTLVHADGVFLAQVRLDGERVQVWVNQFDLTQGQLIYAIQHVFAYDPRAEIYEREVAFMLHGLDIPNGSASVSPQLAKKKTSSSDPAVASGAASCFAGVPCRAVPGLALGLGCGLGAISVGVGVYEWYAARQDFKAWKGLLQVDPQQWRLRAHGQSKARAGDIGVGVGVALALAGGVVAWIGAPLPSAEDMAEDVAEDVAENMPEHTRKHAHRVDTFHPTASLQIRPAPNGGWVEARGTF